MNRNLILVRGIPGSGKTTFAFLASQDQASVFSADDYFMDFTDGNGKYNFDASKIHLAHASCEKRTEGAMVTKTPLIFVANTFTTEWEMSAYFKLAEKYGYNVFSIIVENRHGNTNIHDVPEEKLDAMRKRFNIQL